MEEQKIDVSFFSGHFKGLFHHKEDDEVVVSGCLPDHVWNADQIVSSNHHAVGNGRFKVIEVVEQRDHRGVFKNPQHKINSYFKIKLQKIN